MTSSLVWLAAYFGLWLTVVSGAAKLFDWLEVLRSEFGLNYGFLNDYDVQLEKCREVYEEVLGDRETFENEAVAVLGALIGAHLGHFKADGEKFLRERMTDEGVEDIRKRARSLIRLRGLGGIGA